MLDIFKTGWIMGLDENVNLEVAPKWMAPMAVFQLYLQSS